MSHVSESSQALSTMALRPDSHPKLVPPNTPAATQYQTIHGPPLPTSINSYGSNTTTLDITLLQKLPRDLRFNILQDVYQTCSPPNEFALKGTHPATKMFFEIICSSATYYIEAMRWLLDTSLHIDDCERLLSLVNMFKKWTSEGLEGTKLHEDHQVRLDRGEAMLRNVISLRLEPWLRQITETDKITLFDEQERAKLKEEIRTMITLFTITAPHLRRLILSLKAPLSARYTFRHMQDLYADLWTSLLNLKKLQLFCCVYDPPSDLVAPPYTPPQFAIVKTYIQMLQSWPDLGILAMQDIPLDETRLQQALYRMPKLTK